MATRRRIGRVGNLALEGRSVLRRNRGFVWGPPTAAPRYTDAFGDSNKRLNGRGPSTILPTYITATRSLMCLTTEKIVGTKR